MRDHGRKRRNITNFSRPFVCKTAKTRRNGFDHSSSRYTDRRNARTRIANMSVLDCRTASREQFGITRGCGRKVPRFIERRRANFARLRRCLEPLEEQLILPEATPGSEPSWFGLPLTLREPSTVSRNALIEFLDSRRIGTRLLFGGNLLRQPAYRAIPHRQVGALEEADRVMRQTFWVGVYPGLTTTMLDYVAASLREALGSTG